MARDKTRPGERRRRKGKKKANPKSPSFLRPVEWALSELSGVVAWLGDLKGPSGERFPVGWRNGQIKHYTKRAKMLRAEIKAASAAAAAEKSEGGDGPKAA